MGWAIDLGYTHSPEQTLAKVERKLQQLTNDSDQIYIVGHSMGATTLAYYEPYIRGYINGIILVSPGHIIKRKVFINQHGPSIELAKQLVAQGLGDEVTTLPSWNGVFEYQLSATPNLYLEWSCSNELDFDENVCNINSPTLFVTSNDEMDTRIGSTDRNRMFSRIPAEYKDFRIVESTHSTILRDSKEIIIDWINELSSDRFYGNGLYHQST